MIQPGPHPLATGVAHATFAERTQPMARTSLLDDAAPSKLRTGGGGGASGMDQQKMIKIGAAVAMLLVAGVLVAWNAGLFESRNGSSTATNPQIAPKVQEEMKKQVEQQKEFEKALPPPSGS
jgi:hypothetical protein